MNIEDQAKRQLFDYDLFDNPTRYDPYRNHNILKDSNRPVQAPPKSMFSTFCQNITRRKWNSHEKNNENSNRISLKKLLERLESMPSPEKNQRKPQNPRLKTVQIMSSTLPSTLKKTSVFVKTCNDECLSANEVQKQRVFQTSKKTSVITPKTKKSKRGEEAVLIQKLIKQKLAEKQWKIKNKTEKLINFLQTNKVAESTKSKGMSTYSKFNSRKLISFLS